jgi:hypothetical protein
MMDTLPIGSSDPDNQFCISPNCAENFEFTNELLSFPFKKPPVLIAYCRKFIASCQEKLLLKGDQSLDSSGSHRFGICFA